MLRQSRPQIDNRATVCNVTVAVVVSEKIHDTDLGRYTRCAERRELTTCAVNYNEHEDMPTGASRSWPIWFLEGAEAIMSFLSVGERKEIASELAETRALIRPSNTGHR